MRLLTLIALLPCIAMADSIRTSDGVSCSNNLDNPLTFEVYGEDSEELSVGVSVTYEWGAPEQLDCNRLYEMELARKEMELEQLRAQIEALKAVKDVQWTE